MKKITIYFYTILLVLTLITCLLMYKTNNGPIYHALKNKMIIDIGADILNRNNLIPDSYEFWKASSYDFEQSENYVVKNGNLVYSVSDLPLSEFQNKIYQKLKNEFNEEDTLGVIYKPHSSIAAEICGSDEIKQFITENANELLKGLTIKNANIHFHTYNNMNLGTAFGDADILFMYIDKDESINFIIMDTYSFNKGENIFVEMARSVHETNIARKYYILTIQSIPLK